MSDNTRYAEYQLDLFFKSADARIEELLDTKNFEYHADFLNHYIRNFPTLGDTVYQHIFRSTGLQAHYADYTLRQLLDAGDPKVEQKRKDFHGGRSGDTPFHVHYYNKYILEKTEAMTQAGSNEELERFLKNWQKKLGRKGYTFQNDTKESATARNIAFHMAFALDMDVKTLKEILLKCLLQQVVNPKNHMECIFWYCLSHKIPYQQMRKEYLDYYRSEAFDDAYRNALEKGIVDTKTLDLLSDFADVLKKGKEEFCRYLWRLKYTEKRIAEGQKTELGTVSDERALRWKTPGTVYWENICHFVDVEDPSTVKDTPTESGYAARFPVIWNSLRESCYERNRDPLLDRETLNALFGCIDYTKRGIESRKLAFVEMPRTEIIATQFIACCTRGPARNLPRDQLRKRFLKEVNKDLVNSGLRKFYLRSPFELFIILCFLHEDPFCYFMASWEEAARKD